MEIYHSGQCYQCINPEITEEINDIDDYDEFGNSEKLRKISNRYNSYDEYLDFEEDISYNERFSDLENTNIWNDNILFRNQYNIYYKSHPCNFCKYKGIAECIFIFDMAFSHKGEIKIVVEINNTSPVKKNKIDFCKENDITLIQINAKDINRVTLRDTKIVPCEILNINKSISSGSYITYIKDLRKDSTEKFCLTSIHDLFYKLYGIDLANI